MGMIGNYLRVSNEELEAYLKNSSELEDRIYKDDAEGDDNLIDIEKSWDGIFFLLTGKSISTFDEAAAPLCWILSGPQEIDPDQDLGYGPATYITAEQTKEISRAMENFSRNELEKAYDGKRMTELSVYPGIWDDPHDDALDYLVENFNTLRDFYHQAAIANQAVITFIN